MSLSVFLLASVTVTTLLSTVCTALCGDTCRFRLCDAATRKVLSGTPTIILRGPGQTGDTYICNEPSPFNIGLVRTTGEAILSKPDPRTRISEFKDPGLSVPFRKTFFGIRQLPLRPGRKGIVQQGLRGNQGRFLNGECVIVNLLDWDLLRPDGSVAKRNIRSLPGTSRSACVSFQVRVPAVLVELTWDSGDDMDLEVREPGGVVIGQSNPTTAAGTFKGDIIGICGQTDIGRETIFYPLGKSRVLKRGSYSVSVKHFFDCGKGSNWKLSVLVGNEIVFTSFGRATGGRGAIVFSRDFTV